ncbi:MAG: HipA domain-containing protein [Opitutaceae bacterium]|nr:HipA domain-containing protein [Opitutaceae bacterium]
MSKRQPDNLDLLREELSAGPRTGLDLELALDISGPTLSRLLVRAGDQIERIGAARRSRYGLRRPVRNLGDEWPVFVVEHDATVRLLGRLRSLHGAYRFLPASGNEGGPLPPCVSEIVSPRLPFFLMSARPGGYLGRYIARRFSERSGTPTDVRDWTDDDSLEYFIQAGTDLPGNVLVGEAAKERAIQEIESARVRRSESLAHVRSLYPEMIASAREGGAIGSSADGEQPKFLTTVDGGGDGRHRSLIVKFSPPVSTATGRRWADLLVCEHLAAAAINRAGGKAANNEVYFDHGRCFLESERFDRTVALGRVGVIAIGVITYAVAGRGADDWGHAATLLETKGLLPAGDAQAIRWAQCFGRLIANEDMHEANAALLWERASVFRFAPIYDMLPMLYRPNEQGEVVPRVFRPTVPDVDTQDVWKTAAEAACEFWDAVAVDQRVSQNMRQEAARNVKKVAW